MTPIPRGLLIAGGLGLAGGAGFLLFKNMSKKPEEGAATDPAAAGAGGMTPTAGTPGAAGPGAPGLTPTGTTTPGAPGAGLGAGTGSGKLAGGQQVGPYTVIPDPQSGQMMVFETATEQPVGILDAQGNLVPLEGSGGALGPGAGTGVPEGAGLTPTGGLGPVAPEGAGLTPTGTTSSVPQAATGQAQFKAIAQDLFANAGNSGVGSASSDAMAGQTNLAPTTGLDAGAARSATTGIGAPAALGAGTGTGAATGGVTREQVGNFTLVDDGSGTKVVLDTASQTPVAMMDAAGTVTPISVDAQGNVSVTGAPLSSAQVGAAVSGGTGAGTGAPAGMLDARAGSSPYASAATVTPATTVTSPVGAGVPGLQ